MHPSYDIVVLGLALTSSWGNGHATTYRSLIKGLQRRGSRVLFLERDQPWYAQHRDFSTAPYCEIALYSNLKELRHRYGERLRRADAVIAGSYVAQGREVNDWVLTEARGIKCFYDIDTPVTLASLATDSCEYLRRDQIPGFDLVLSFTGGPTLQTLEKVYGAQHALPLYCSVDIDQHTSVTCQPDIDLGYMGTYSADRQAGLEGLLNVPARRLPGRSFMVVGAQYPTDIPWPANVARIAHLAADEHSRFYSRQRYTLNLTRMHMRAAGYSPSVRLFEAAACATPVISDDWAGLDEFFFPGDEIIVAHNADEVVERLEATSEVERRRIGLAARSRVLEAHSGERRAVELRSYLENAGGAGVGYRRLRAQSRAVVS